MRHYGVVDADAVSVAAAGATTGAVTGATDVATVRGAEPCRNRGNHVVLYNTAKWISNDVTITAPRKIGTPIVGFTTVQIRPSFIVRAL